MTEVAPIDGTVRIDGAVWRFCPIGGYECFRIRNDAYIARDVIAVHVEVSHGMRDRLALISALMARPTDRDVVEDHARSSVPQQLRVAGK